MCHHYTAICLKSDEVRTVQQALDSMVTREVVHMNAGSEAEVCRHGDASTVT